MKFRHARISLAVSHAVAMTPSIPVISPRKVAVASNCLYNHCERNHLREDPHQTPSTNQGVVLMSTTTELKSGTAGLTPGVWNVDASHSTIGFVRPPPDGQQGPRPFRHLHRHDHDRRRSVAVRRRGDGRHRVDHHRRRQPRRPPEVGRLLRRRELPDDDAGQHRHRAGRQRLRAAHRSDDQGQSPSLSISTSSSTASAAIRGAAPAPASAPRPRSTARTGAWSGTSPSRPVACSSARRSRSSSTSKPSRPDPQPDLDIRYGGTTA